MISATVRACAFAGVERSAMSWPSVFRLSEALKVAKRMRSLPAAAGGTSMSATRAATHAPSHERRLGRQQWIISGLLSQVRRSQSHLPSDGWQPGATNVRQVETRTTPGFNASSTQREARSSHDNPCPARQADILGRRETKPPLSRTSSVRGRGWVVGAEFRARLGCPRSAKCCHRANTVVWFDNNALRFAGLFMGGTGLEPVTPSLSSWCSPN
jgi:hypothetical protein